MRGESVLDKRGLVKNIYPMLTSTISEQGQTTIPANIRKALKSPPGTVLSWQVNGGKAEVVPLTEAGRKRRTYDYEAHLKDLKSSPTVDDHLLSIPRSHEFLS